MIRSPMFSLVLAAAAAGCAGGAVVDRPAGPPAAPSGCRVLRTSGDVAALRRGTGELVVVVGEVDLLRSFDDGRSWRREALPAHCRWPDVAELDGRLLVSCSEPTPPGRLLLLRERVDGGWRAPLAVASSAGIFIDTHLQPLEDGSVLLLATDLDRPGDLDTAVYRLELRRSDDGGTTWSGPDTVLSGRRGLRLEDTRTVRLADGAVLLAVERETGEGLPSTVRQLRSTDGGRSWSAPAVLWRGGDIEPGGYVSFADGELWFVASSDERAGGGSYARAMILVRRSFDGGRSWSRPEVLVDREDQLSFGGVELADDEVLLPSVRRYLGPRRLLALYVVSRQPGGGVRCASAPPLVSR